MSTGEYEEAMEAEARCPKFCTSCSGNLMQLEVLTFICKMEGESDALSGPEEEGSRDLQPKLGERSGWSHCTWATPSNAY